MDYRSMEFWVTFKYAIIHYAIQCFAIAVWFRGFKIVIMGLISAVFFEEEKCKGQDVGVLYFLTICIALSVKKGFCFVKDNLVPSM